MVSKAANHTAPATSFTVRSYQKAVQPFEQQFGLRFPRFEGEKNPETIEKSLLRFSDDDSQGL